MRTLLSHESFHFPPVFSKIEWGLNLTTPALSYPLYTVINTVVPPATSAQCDNYCGRYTWNIHFQINFTQRFCLINFKIFFWILGINVSVPLPLLFLKSLFHSVSQPTLPPAFISTPCCCIFPIPTIYMLLHSLDPFWTSSKPLLSHLPLSHLQLYFTTAHYTTNKPFLYFISYQLSPSLS